MRAFEDEKYSSEYARYQQEWYDNGKPEIILDDFENLIWEVSYTFDMLKAKWVAMKLREEWDMREKGEAL